MIYRRSPTPHHGTRNTLPPPGRRDAALLLGGLLTAAAAGASPAAAPHTPNAAIAQAEAEECFRALAERRARDYDRTRDISPRQLLALLDVAERTGYSLGLLLATGEHESAHTWNNFVRPPLGGGRVGAAAGVWQFQPQTFQRVIHRYGAKLLALTAADPAAHRRRLDLGFGPFHDGQVRLIIRDTVDGLRDAEDRELQLLRHDFIVLALAKYLLSEDSGATNPVEDYLFHFLGPVQGRRILTLAEGDERNTRTVQPPPPPDQPQPAAAGRIRDTLPGRPAPLLQLAPRGYKPLTPGGTPPPGARAADAMLQRPGEPPLPPPRHPAPRQWPAPHGYEHDSPVVTGNAGMFYRDGQGRSDPYTWAEFLQNLERRVKAGQQPKLVRAKYGVGFDLAGGDLPDWAFDPDHPGPMLLVRMDDGSGLALPKAQITAPLTRAETRDYERRLATLIGLGQTAPTAMLSDASARALWRLGLLTAPADSAAAKAQPSTRTDPLQRFATDMGPGWGSVVRTDTPAVRDALHAFRALVGKAPPDDPAQAKLVLPAEQAALEVYGARIERMLAARRDAGETQGEATANSDEPGDKVGS